MHRHSHPRPIARIQPLREGTDRFRGRKPGRQTKTAGAAAADATADAAAAAATATRGCPTERHIRGPSAGAAASPAAAQRRRLAAAAVAAAFPPLLATAAAAKGTTSTAAKGEQCTAALRCRHRLASLLCPTASHSH